MISLNAVLVIVVVGYRQILHKVQNLAGLTILYCLLPPSVPRKLTSSYSHRYSSGSDTSTKDPESCHAIRRLKNVFISPVKIHTIPTEHHRSGLPSEESDIHNGISNQAIYNRWEGNHTSTVTHLYHPVIVDTSTHVSSLGAFLMREWISGRVSGSEPRAKTTPSFSLSASLSSARRLTTHTGKQASKRSARTPRHESPAAHDVHDASGRKGGGRTT